MGEGALTEVRMHTFVYIALTEVRKPRRVGVHAARLKPRCHLPTWWHWKPKRRWSIWGRNSKASGTPPSSPGLP